MFPPFFNIFHMCMLRSSMQKFRHFQPMGLVHKAKNTFYSPKNHLKTLFDTQITITNRMTINKIIFKNPEISGSF